MYHVIGSKHPFKTLYANRLCSLYSEARRYLTSIVNQKKKGLTSKLCYDLPLLSKKSITLAKLT